MNEERRIEFPNSTIEHTPTKPVGDAKRHFQAAAEEASKPQSNRNKAFQAEIMAARVGGQGKPMNPEQAPASPAAAPVDEVAARNARKAAMNAKFANLGSQTAVKKTPEQRDSVLGSTDFKKRFQENRQVIVQWEQKVQAAAQKNVMRLLHVHFDELQPAPEQMIQFADAPMAASPAAQMNAQHMFAAKASPLKFNLPAHEIGEEAGEVRELQTAPVKQITYEEITSFRYLRQAGIVKLPEGCQATADNIKEKLADFMEITSTVNPKLFKAFLQEHVIHSRKLIALQNASPRYKGQLQYEFDAYSARFHEQFKDVVVAVIRAVSCMSVLIPCIESNLGAAVETYTQLTKEYETQGRSFDVQFKKILMDKCSPNIAAVLGHKDVSEGSVLVQIQDAVVEQAMRKGDEATLNMFYQ